MFLPGYCGREGFAEWKLPRAETLSGVSFKELPSCKQWRKAAHFDFVDVTATHFTLPPLYPFVEGECLGVGLVVTVWGGPRLTLSLERHVTLLYSCDSEMYLPCRHIYRFSRCVVFVISFHWLHWFSYFNSVCVCVCWRFPVVCVVLQHCAELLLPFLVMHCLCLF